MSAIALPWMPSLGPLKSRLDQWFSGQLLQFDGDLLTPHPGGIVQAADLIITQPSQDTNSNNLSSYTWAGMSYGAVPGAGQKRWIVACTFLKTQVAYTSVTLGGVTATLVHQQDADGNSRSAIHVAEVPTGTTGTTTINLGGSSSGAGVAIYRIISDDISDLTASHDTAGDPTNTSGVCSVSGVDVPAGGVAVGLAFGNNNGTTTWTELVKDTEQDVETNENMSSASNSYATVQTGLTITATSSDTTPSDYGLNVVTWGPSGAT